MQQTQTLIVQLPSPERDAFRQTALEIKDKYRDQYAFWLALADEFEKLTRVQDIPLPEVGRKLEQEIFTQQLLGEMDD